MVELARRDPAEWPHPDERHRIHWAIEHGLREELLASAPQDRAAVTRDVYNRLFAAVPWHDANVRTQTQETSYERQWFRRYGPLTRPTDTLIDLGCGRGGLVRQFSRGVAECIGLDVSDTMVELARQDQPANVRFVVGDLMEPPLPPGSVDFAVSRQVMEHLHPEDVPRHLAAIRRLLRPGGRYLVETPSRLTGPWDISRGITDVATGFHLREYTNGELAGLMRDAGFSRVTAPALPARMMMRLTPATVRRAYLPVGPKTATEALLDRAPARLRHKAAGPLAVREVVLVGTVDP